MPDWYKNNLRIGFFMVKYYNVMTNYLQHGHDKNEDYFMVTIAPFCLSTGKKITADLREEKYLTP
jgi:hypothetical protein